MKKHLEKRKKIKKENEKVANRKLGNLGNLWNIRKVIPNFLVSEFSVLPKNSDLKISEKKFPRSLRFPSLRPGLLFCRIEPFGSSLKLQTLQSNHFVPLLRLFKNSWEREATRTIGAKRVHVSVSKMESSLSCQQCRLKFPKSTTSFLSESINRVPCYLLSPSSTICCKHFLWTL